jgi:hypothetical protein
MFRAAVLAVWRHLGKSEREIEMVQWYINSPVEGLSAEQEAALANMERLIAKLLRYPGYKLH